MALAVKLSVCPEQSVLLADATGADGIVFMVTVVLLALLMQPVAILVAVTE